MKTQSDKKPDSIQAIGKGNYYVNMNIIVKEVEGSGFEEDETRIEYEYDTVKVSGYPTYEIVVEKLIRERYTVSEELAIQRQREIKKEEFDEYNSFCEECKNMARVVFNIQNGGE